MRSRRLTRWLILAAVPVTVTMGAVPAGVASAASTAGGAQHQYIVILRDQNSAIRATSPARGAAAHNEQAPVLARLSSLGGHATGGTSVVNAIFANLTAGQAQALAANPAVARVVPNGVIRGASPFGSTDDTGLATGAGTPGNASNSLCGTSTDPQLNPEALYNINAVSPGADGAGVKVALIADGLDPAEADFQRNAAFATTASPAGSPVVTQQDFSTDPATAPTAGGEAFLDASAIAAQANTTYDLNDFVNPAHSLGTGCDIKIQGVAPGSDVLALKVFSSNNQTTNSAFFQAINYAVAHGAKVINESFGTEAFPDTASADLTRIADDAAVAAGVTVVVSTGDGGFTNTVASPASDPNVISVGATTTFRAYAQGAFGGYNDPAVTNPQYVDNNIASFSSSGVTQGGRTLDLVAPGDSNWAVCDPNDALYTDCTTEQGTGAQIELGGGTSQSAPLTSGAAADVIQAYAAHHGGHDPSPALVKRILLSTAADISAPADMQGAGLLDVAAAVKLASTIGASHGSGSGGVEVNTSQVDVAQNPGATSARTISITNTSAAAVKVSLSTRKLTQRVGSVSGHFCLQPGTPSTSCPANTGVFPIWSGVSEVYQNVHFTVPKRTRRGQLSFSADYQYTGQTSLLHFALIEPDGAYAGYSDPQGLGDFGSVVVANPPPGTWTAVFFTAQNDTSTSTIGTSGPIQWNAATTQYASGSVISPSVLTLGAGQTGAARLLVTSPSTAGDQSQAVVVSTAANRTTVPVVVRTLIKTTRSGGSYHGVLTGGNGRAQTQAQANDYVFNVPRGARAISASLKLANDPNDVLSAQLIAPGGENLGYSTNVTFTPQQLNLNEFETTRFVNIYHAHPAAGRWTLVLEWANPVSGRELSEPFSGTVSFSGPRTTSTLPRGARLKRAKTYRFRVTIHNSGRAGEWVFADPRKNRNATVTLADQNSQITSGHVTLPVPLPNVSTGQPYFPYYLVPTLTSQLNAQLKGNAPVDFELNYLPGDPDVEGVRHGDSASLSFRSPQVSPGLWALIPAEIGPFGSAGAPAGAATASLKAVTKAFDRQVRSSTGNLWSLANGGSGTFNPVYVPAGATRGIRVTIRSTAAVGSYERGRLYLDDVAVAGLVGLFGETTGDVLSSVPYSFRVVR